MLEWLESAAHDSAFQVAAPDLHQSANHQVSAQGKDKLPRVMPFLPGVAPLLLVDPYHAPSLDSTRLMVDALHASCY
jgi:hypothetical protein